MNKVKFTLPKENAKKSKIYKVLIVDDDIPIHELTIFLLNNFDYKDYKLEFISAYSGQEANEIIKNTPNIALILLDVVMETPNAGFEVVQYVRDELKNYLVRIIIRTGQPGYAPEKEVINKYEINNYLEKTNLDSTRFYTTIVVALRSYQDLINLQNQNKIISYQSKMAAMGEMIENISHQWKQPLNTISIAAATVKIKEEMDNLNKETINKCMDTVSSSVQYLTQTINDFRDFFKTDKIKEEFTLAKTFDKTLKLLVSQFKSENISIIKNIDDIIITEMEKELIQVFINILNNARDELIKKKNGNKFIFIDTIKSNDFIEINIKDNAGGIPNEIIENVFNSHFTTKEDSGGMGIGLYMSKTIIEENMNGTIKVDNIMFTYEKLDCTGAQFKIILPVN